MGATTPIMILRGAKTGQAYSLGLYFAGSDAAGYIVPCTYNGVASATSPTDFVVPEPCYIEHISGPATGRLTIDADGMPSVIQIDLATVLSMVSKTGTQWGKLGGGKRYRLRVVSAMAA